MLVGSTWLPQQTFEKGARRAQVTRQARGDAVTQLPPCGRRAVQVRGAHLREHLGTGAGATRRLGGVLRLVSTEPREGAGWPQQLFTDPFVLSQRQAGQVTAHWVLLLTPLGVSPRGDT